MPVTFKTILKQVEDKDATGIHIPIEVIEQLGGGKRPAVKVTINGYTYRSTVAVYGGICMVGVNKENRAATGVKGGDEIEVTLELDTEPRLIEVPADLAAALAAKPGARAAFDALSTSTRKEHVRQVESAKAAETRTRRIANIVDSLPKA